MGTNSIEAVSGLHDDVPAGAGIGVRAVGESAGGAFALRRRLMTLAVVADVVSFLVAYFCTLSTFALTHGQASVLATASSDWGLAVSVVLILLVFTVLGLYKLEAWVSRPLHLLTLFRATVVALFVTAFAAFAFKAPLVSDSRFTVFFAFALFFVIGAVVRLRFVDREYVRDVRERPGATLVVGWSADGGILISRLKELRGFAQVRTIQPADRRRNGFDAEPWLLETIGTAQPAPRQVFLDGGSLGHKAVFDLIHAARARGCEVYVIGRLSSPLDASGLLSRLFEIPVMRVRRDVGVRPGGAASAAMRAFDIVLASLALAVLSPFLVVIAVLVKRDSPGPVFYRQERVGAGGRRFQMLKFRSMTVGSDACQHRDSVSAFIQGDVVDCMDQTDEYGRRVYKITGDSRVTRVGARLRRYSLDELPQFWNVLKGDMRIIGPRPALPYEVEVYRPWHRMRLEMTPGVSGLWQIAGRSRVDFDDMVYQDVIYGLNQSLLTDLHLCLRTVPAMLTGSGAA
jgi:exopolysaccharide biosynthesis polyprenyl glycosylphosphotransferase